MDAATGPTVAPLRPNLFLIGAPRSGSRSLYEYLRGHPRIFMSAPKEPNFFCDDLPGLSAVEDEAGYLRLFRRADERHIAIGEASVWYLYSRVAARRLRSFNPRARILVLLRNPIDVVESLHGLFRLVGVEDEPDLERALRLQDRRRSGEALPRQCPNPDLLQYTRIARHGENLARWLEVFPDEQTCPVVFDDFVADPGDTYRRILEFIGVPDDGRTEFPHRNEHRTPRLGVLARILLDPPPPIRAVGRGGRRALRAMGINDVGFMRRLRLLTTRPAARPRMDGDLRRRLAEEFAPDVHRLSTLLERDLSGWTEPTGLGEKLSATPG